MPPENDSRASAVGDGLPPADNGSRDQSQKPSSGGDSGFHANSPADLVPPSSDVVAVGVDIPAPGVDEPRLADRVKTLLIGKPRDLWDQSVFKHVSLVAFLAWVGLGADGLSSSCYGPPEAFDNLGQHRFLAVFLSLAIMATVFIISACYSHIVEAFPSGGGGYLVATKLLGRPVGVVSGCALLVDYVLTITVSIAAAGDALFGLLDPAWSGLKLPAEYAAIVVLLVLNLRGVKESVQFLVPIFLTFLLTHILVIGGALVLHIGNVGILAHEVSSEVSKSLADPNVGLLGMLFVLFHAYSMGAGTYTGLEAVSSAVPVMREPRVATAQRTMVYMAFSLSLTAGGLILAYLLLDIRHDPSSGKTLNQVLTEGLVQGIGLGGTWLGWLGVVITLVSEGALLFVAAQAGFIGGPRVLANMAQDSWVPHWFANLSERLATHNGVALMSLSALGALWYTQGVVSTLVIMYSINVFITFSLSMIGMMRHWWQQRQTHPLWRRRLALFTAGGVLCVSILTVTVLVKFAEGGWRTILLTGVLVAVCGFVHRYYRHVGIKLKKLDEALGKVTPEGEPNLAEPSPDLPTAVVLVGRYSGLGIHTLLNALCFVPDYFQNLVFVSVGVVDSENFKGAGAMEDLRRSTTAALEQYVQLGQRLGLASTSYMAFGTDAVDDLEQLCLIVARSYRRSVVFAGQLVFEKDSWKHRLLHNQTAFSLQRRLQWAGLPMVILPTRVR